MFRRAKEAHAAMGRRQRFANEHVEREAVHPEVVLMEVLVVVLPVGKDCELGRLRLHPDRLRA
jgi:hypothetical protein